MSSATASTVPEPSLCGMRRGYGIPTPNASSRFLTSPGLTPEKAMRIRTSAVRGWGSSMSPTTSGARGGWGRGGGADLIFADHTHAAAHAKAHLYQVRYGGDL